MTDGSYRFHGEGSVRLHQLPGWLIGWVNMSDKSSEPPPGSSGCYVRRATCYYFPYQTTGPQITPYTSEIL